MPVDKPYNQYKKTQITTANQGKLIVMLYDGALRFVNRAIELIPSKSIEDIHINIVRAQDIIGELITSLNMDAGEIAHRLFSIYMYINRRLTAANIHKDEKPLLEVKKYLTELREAWEEAAKKVQPDTIEAEKGGINIAT